MRELAVLFVSRIFPWRRGGNLKSVNYKRERQDKVGRTPKPIDGHSGAWTVVQVLAFIISLQQTSNVHYGTSQSSASSRHYQRGWRGHMGGNSAHLAVSWPSWQRLCAQRAGLLLWLRRKEHLPVVGVCFKGTRREWQTLAWKQRWQSTAPVKDKCHGPPFIFWCCFLQRLDALRILSDINIPEQTTVIGVWDLHIFSCNLKKLNTPC